MNNKKIWFLIRLNDKFNYTDIKKNYNRNQIFLKITLLLLSHDCKNTCLIGLFLIYMRACVTIRCICAVNHRVIIIGACGGLKQNIG